VQRIYDAAYKDLVTPLDNSSAIALQVPSWLWSGNAARQQRQRDEDAATQQVTAKAPTLACLVCPPNFYCLGGANPPNTVLPTSRTPDRPVLLYGVLPVGASGPQWWVPCPHTGARDYLVLSRGPSLSLASCFGVAQRWTQQQTLLTGLQLFVFPSMLHI